MFKKCLWVATKREKVNRVIEQKVANPFDESFYQYLVPPSFSAGAEVLLRPGGEHDGSVGFNSGVGKSKWKRGRSTNNRSSGSVLRSVAWADELVVGSCPWDDAAQVSAHGVKTIGFDGLVFLDDKVAKQ
jgi:hypothetical protein